MQEQTWARTWARVTAGSPQQNKGYRSAIADVSLESPFLAQNKRSAVSLEKPTPKPTSSDSKISRLESGLFKACKDNKTRGLLTKQAAEIHDSSPKAESP